MKRLLRSRKALSPVVAAIILIAVTVAVSIAVAAWMGALTFTFMQTEQLEIQGATFADGTTITLQVKNTGTATLTVDKFKLGLSGTQQEITDVPIGQGESTTVSLPTSYVSGTTYDIYVITTTGKQFMYRATAP